MRLDRAGLGNYKAPASQAPASAQPAMRQTGMADVPVAVPQAATAAASTAAASAPAPAQPGIQLQAATVSSTLLPPILPAAVKAASKEATSFASLSAGSGQQTPAAAAAPPADIAGSVSLATSAPSAGTSSQVLVLSDSDHEEAEPMAVNAESGRSGRATTPRPAEVTLPVATVTLE